MTVLHDRLVADKDSCFLSKKLATIKTDVDIPIDIEEFKLPKNIKSIGDYCIGIEYYPVKPVYISQNVETIGKHAFTFLKNIDVVDKNKPRIKFVVDKKNKYYKSDKKGWIYTKDGKKVWSSSKRY